MLLRATLSAGFWNGFLLSKAHNDDFPCRFCGNLDGDGRVVQHFRDAISKAWQDEVATDLCKRRVSGGALFSYVWLTSTTWLFSSWKKRQNSVACCITMWGLELVVA